MGLTLFLLFAGLAVVLTMFGIYAMVAYSVATRTREIGIRVALGAQRSRVLGFVVRQGLVTVGLGLGAGLLAFAASSATLDRFMFALPAGTPLSLALLAAGVLMVAAVALIVPSRRALGIDPSVALRGD
jgi:ABC-type antimicrobial peptide transport system permease subunit